LHKHKNSNYSNKFKQTIVTSIAVIKVNTHENSKGLYQL